MIIREIKNLYGREKTVVPSISISTFVLFVSLLIYFDKYVKLQYVYNNFNFEMATIAGVFAGFLFAGVGILCASNTPMMTKLNITGNIRTVYNIFFSSILFFSLSLIIYFLKPLIVFDIHLIQTFTKVQYMLIQIVLLTGIYSFINGFALFIYALWALKKILVPKQKNSESEKTLKLVR
jgi:hypothetical protein